MMTFSTVRELNSVLGGAAFVPAGAANTATNKARKAG